MCDTCFWMLIRFRGPIGQCCTFVLTVGPAVTKSLRQSRAAAVKREKMFRVTHSSIDAGGLSDTSRSAGIG